MGSKQKAAFPRGLQGTILFPVLSQHLQGCAPRHEMSWEKPSVAARVSKACGQSSLLRRRVRPTGMLPPYLQTPQEPLRRGGRGGLCQAAGFAFRVESAPTTAY